MKINFNNLVKDKDGKEIGVEYECLVVNEKMQFVYDNQGNPVNAVRTDRSVQKTFLDVALDSLVREVTKPNEVIGNKKGVERYELFKKLRASKKKGGLIVDLSLDECTLLKEVVGDCQNILTYGQFVDVIEGRFEEEKEVECESKPEKKTK
jgi:hypothetical protein